MHRYDSYSTKSIYLKLDYGAMNSIRISDHEGKKHLKYKYNVVLNCTNPHWEKDTDCWRYYCGTNNHRLDELVCQILADKIYKKSFGGYNSLMEYYKNNRNIDAGFWLGAKEVKLNDNTRITEANS